MMAFLKRWQEFTGWTPLIVVLAVVGWIVLGGLDPRLGPDRVGLLLDLPIITAYALVASGVAYLFWRRWSNRLSDEQKARLWDGLMKGQTGAIVVYCVNAAFYLTVTVLVFRFFKPAV